MEKLDFSDYIDEAESKEITDLKDKVRKTAKAYAKRYGWCDAVDRALIEAGITVEDESNPKIKVKTAVGEVEIEMSNWRSLQDKSLEEQKAAVMVEVNLSVNVSKNRKAAGTVNIPVELVEEWEVLPNPKKRRLREYQENVDSLNLPALAEGHMWSYSSDAARVLHVFPRLEETSYGYIESICCSVTVLEHVAPLTRAPHGTGRTCARCIERGRNRDIVLRGRPPTPPVIAA